MLLLSVLVSFCHLAGARKVKEPPWEDSHWGKDVDTLTCPGKIAKQIPPLTVRPFTTFSPEEPDIPFQYQPYIWRAGGCSLSAAINKDAEVSAGADAVPRRMFSKELCTLSKSDTNASGIHDDEERLEGYTLEQLYSRQGNHGDKKAIIYVWYVSKTLGSEGATRKLPVSCVSDSEDHKHLFLPLVLWFSRNGFDDNDVVHNKGYGDLLGAWADGMYVPRVAPHRKAVRLLS